MIEAWRKSIDRSGRDIGEIGIADHESQRAIATTGPPAQPGGPVRNLTYHQLDVTRHQGSTDGVWGERVRAKNDWLGRAQVIDAHDLRALLRRERNASTLET